MEQIKKVILIPRCVLSPGFKSSASISREEQEEIMKVLFDSETGIIQLPCPHLNSIIAGKETECSTTALVNSFIDKNRNGKVTKLYRKILKPVLSEIEEYRQQGIIFAGIVGVKGSPSCSLGIKMNDRKSEPGQYMKALVKSLDKKSFSINMADI